MSDQAPDPVMAKRKLEEALSEYLQSHQGSNWAMKEYVLVIHGNNLENSDEYDYLFECRGRPHALEGLHQIGRDFAKEMLEETSESND